MDQNKKILDIMTRLNKLPRGSEEYRQAEREALEMVKETSQKPQTLEPTPELANALNQVMQHPDTCPQKEQGCSLCDGKKKITQVQNELQILMQTGKPPVGGLLETAKKQLDEMNREKS